MTEKEEYTLDDLKYLRFGHIDRGRSVDILISHAVEEIPGDGVLPKRWRWMNYPYFLKKYGDLGDVLWAKTASYHLLMVEGIHVFRIWADSADTAVVDVSDYLAVKLARVMDVEEIPESVYRKSKPFTKRVRIQTLSELLQIINLTKKLCDL